MRSNKVKRVRKDIKIFDTTIRDGGLCNNFMFSDEFVKELYKTNIKCGVDYMEFGYKSDNQIFSQEEFGKWKFCNEDDIRSIVGENVSDMKLAVMADVGRCNYKSDFLPKQDSVIDMVRVACYINQISTAIEMIEYLHKLGYETTCNIMAVSQNDINQIEEALNRLINSSVDVIYLVDSYGSLYTEDVAELSKVYLKAVAGNEKKIGFHAHNNQNLAFANTIMAMDYGVLYLDVAALGMGRGAGNCAMELLLGFLNNSKYNICELIYFIETYMVPLKHQGVNWGYDLQYMITGQLNQHPREAIVFTNDKRTDYYEFYKTLVNNSNFPH